MLKGELYFMPNNANINIFCLEKQDIPSYTYNGKDKCKCEVSTDIVHYLLLKNSKYIDVLMDILRW